LALVVQKSIKQGFYRSSPKFGRRILEMLLVEKKLAKGGKMG
jgi:hypothetical protein